MIATSQKGVELLATIPSALQAFVDAGDLAGIVALTWARGELVQAIALGQRDIEAAAPMRRDSLFRIASMTKVVTSVAALMLLDDARLTLEDPIAKWLPEFSDLAVLRDPAGPLDDVEPAGRAATVRDLLTHRAGFGYGLFSEGPISRAYDEIVGPLHGNTKTPDEWLAALARLPLRYQPGQQLHYGMSTDVLGFLVARIEGAPLAQVLDRRIFGPLGMVDTGFWVPPAEQDRLAAVYRFDDAAGRLVRVDLPGFTEPLSWQSGGAGLVSTADDYLRFARMLLNAGELDGVRLLRAETVRLMCTDQLTPSQREVPFIGAPTWAGLGFGLGVAIVDVPEKNLLGCGRPGSITWPGAYGTWWQADPVEDIVMVYMIQHAIELTPTSGAAVAAGRGMDGRLALMEYQRLTYAALAGS